MTIFKYMILNPDCALDNGWYINETFKRILCLEYDKCTKYCYCDKCEIDLWTLTKCISNAKPGTTKICSFNNDEDD